MRYFRKKPRKWECGTAESPPPLPRLQILITVTPFFFFDIYKNEKQKQSSLGSLSLLSNDDGDGNEKGKKAIGLDWQNNNCFALCYTTIT